MNALDGAVISMCDDRRRRQEWLKFLRVIDQVTLGGKETYLIADNCKSILGGQGEIAVSDPGAGQWAFYTLSFNALAGGAYIGQTSARISTMTVHKASEITCR